MSVHDWLAWDAAHCWHPYTQHGLAGPPLPVVGAQGSWLTLADGRRMLDAISSWWCCLHGHGREELVEALARQARELDHVLFAGCAHEPASTVARRLSDVAPDGLDRVFFSDNGSTAVEVALKAAYQACVHRGEKERTLFVALDGGYHGDTVGAMSVGDPDPFFTAYAPMLFEVVRAAPDPDALAEVMARVGNRAAALILEPGVQGAAGMVPISDDVLRRARALCDTYGVTLVADEVFTGFGRTGHLFACARAGVTPDALCLSKGLTGGMLPLAVTMFRTSMYEQFLSDEKRHMLFHGHTYTGNPLACAVAIASLDLMAAEDTPVRLDAIGRRIASGLEHRRDDARLAMRRIGGIVALEVAASDEGYLSEVGERLKTAAHEHSPDVLLRPLGNVLYAVPPSSTTREECDLIAKRMDDVLRGALDYSG